jgi:hypothetical protein
MEDGITLSFLLLALLAGIIGAGGMNLFMFIVRRAGIAQADMVRAVGSIFTRSLKSAFSLGLTLHFLLGIIFAVFYFMAFSFLGLSGLPESLIGGLVLGFIQGFVVSIILVVTIAEHHPMRAFRKSGMSVVVEDIIGHVIYGLLVGMVFGLSGIDPAGFSGPFPANLS